MLLVDVLELTLGRRRILAQGIMDTIGQSRRARLNGRAEQMCKTVRALWVDKEAYVRGLYEGLENHLWSGDSRPAYRGIRALCSSKPFPRCNAVRAEGGGLLSEE